ncbi:MAG: hypothetical protein AB7O04_11945 [Hyphomonadaceae bacterium]
MQVDRTHWGIAFCRIGGAQARNWATHKGNSAFMTEICVSAHAEIVNG